MEREQKKKRRSRNLRKRHVGKRLLSVHDRFYAFVRDVVSRLSLGITKVGGNDRTPVPRLHCTLLRSTQWNIIRRYSFSTSLCQVLSPRYNWKSVLRSSFLPRLYRISLCQLEIQSLSRSKDETLFFFLESFSFLPRCVALSLLIRCLFPRRSNDDTD